MSIMRNVLKSMIILSICLNWVCTEGAQDRERKEKHSHTIQLSSLFSKSSSCALSPKASNTKSSMHVVHRYGPCSTLATASPNHADIFSRDQARVNSIHSKISKNYSDRVVKPNQVTNLPAKDGSTLGSANYIVTIGIGTPKLDQSLIFDTGSDLTWIQCEPCSGSCYSQKEKIFNASSSCSYSNVTCSSPLCGSLDSAGVASSCSASNCRYETRYGDDSFTIGNLATEKFTLTPSVVFDGINFGCGDNNQGLFNGVAGLLGLGRNNLSFPSQTAKSYNNIFSYCLPSSSSNTGLLTFGSAGIPRSVTFTPISSFPDPSFYGLNIVEITVGNTKLAIPSTVFSTPGAIIDSGTVITRLPPKAYEAMKTAFKEKMSNYTITSGLSILDTCYNFTGFETVMIPTISFSFSGGAVVELDSGAILYQNDISQVCLGFAGNEGDEDTAIFGNFQQKTLQVVYDGVGNRVGFAPNGCS